MMSGPCTSSAWNAWRRATPSGTPSAISRARLELVLLAPRLGADLVDHVGELGERSPARRRPRPPSRWPGGLHQVPARGRLDEPVHARSSARSADGVDLAVERFDVGPSRDGARDVARDPERADHVGRGAPVSVIMRDTNVMPCEFTTSFEAIVAMISRRSGCSASRSPNRSTICAGKYRSRSRGEVLAVGQVALEQRRVHASASRRRAGRDSSGRVIALPVRAALEHLLARSAGTRRRARARLRSRACTHQVLVRLDPPHRDLFLLRQDLRLEVVVVQDVLHDVGRARLRAARCAPRS